MTDAIRVNRLGGPEHTATRAELEQASDDLFGVVGAAAVRIDVNQSFELKDAADAHRAMEGRKTTGATVMIP